MAAALVVATSSAEAPGAPEPRPGQAARATVPQTLARTVRPAEGRPAGLDFPATHVAFSWRGRADAISFRTVTAPDELSRWRRAPEDHALRGATRHFSSVFAVGRISKVEWRARGRAGDVEVHYMNTLDGPRRRVEKSAAAATAKPAIVTRAQWGADEAIKRTAAGCRRSFWPLQQLFVHHTAGANRDPHPEATMRAIYYFHTVTRGWCDIGYNFVISPDGRVFEGRWARHYIEGEAHDSEDPAGRAVRGAHVEGFNTGSVGISLMGNYSVAGVPTPMKRALVRLLAWEVARHHLDPLARHVYHNPETGLHKRLPVIAGHRDAGQTACPGGNVYKVLPGIRRAVSRAVAGFGARTHTRLSTTDRKVTFGAATSLSGRLSTRAGDPLGGRHVRIVKKLGGRWRLHERVTTKGNGTFSSSLRPRRHAKLAAEFVGARGLWGSDSKLVHQWVGARVSLGLSGGTEDSDGVPHFSPGAVAMRGDVTPARPDGRATVRVARRAKDGTYVVVSRRRARLDGDGAFRVSFTPRRSSQERAFRARAWFWGDRPRGSGHSAARYFVVDPGG